MTSSETQGKLYRKAIDKFSNAKSIRLIKFEGTNLEEYLSKNIKEEDIDEKIKKLEKICELRKKDEVKQIESYDVDFNENEKIFKYYFVDPFGDSVYSIYEFADGMSLTDDDLVEFEEIKEKDLKIENKKETSFDALGSFLAKEL